MPTSDNISIVFGCLAFAILGIVFHFLQEDNPMVMFSSLIGYVRRFNEAIAAKFKTTAWRVVQFEIAGIGFTLMQIGEWVGAITCWVLIATVGVAVAFRSPGDNGKRSPLLSQIFASAGWIAFSVLLITITTLRKPDAEPWTNLSKLWSRQPTITATATPDLRWNINGISLVVIGKAGAIDLSAANTETTFVMAGQITNAGALPSITRNWTLSVLLPDETQERVADLMIFRGKNRGLDIARTDGSNLQQIGNMPLDSAYLPEVTAINPIPAGASSIAGVAMFRLALPMKRIVSGTLITMLFEDVKGKQCGIVKYPYVPNSGDGLNPFWWSPGTPH